MFQSIKAGFGFAVGVIAGFAVLGALVGNTKIEFTKIKKDN